MTVAELCKSIFVGDFTEIKEVGENNNPFVYFDLKYEVSVGKSKSLRVNTIVLFVCQNSRIGHAEFLLSFSIDQSFKRLSKLVSVTGTLNNLNLAVNLNFCFLQKYGVATIFFLYGN
jgi:hypothetical protein